MSRYEQRSDQEIRQLLAANRDSISRDTHGMRLAVDFLEDRHRRHVEAELSARYPSAQASKNKIIPVAIPLANRYAAEAANAYNRPIKREVVNDDGTVNEQLSDDVSAELDDIDFDELMHRAEEIMVLSEMCCLWFQSKNGAMDPTIVTPYSVYPIEPKDGHFVDANDQDAYAAAVVEISDGASISASPDRQLAWVSPAETVFYTAQDPFAPAGTNLLAYPNPFVWPQYDGEDAPLSDLPLQPFVYLHRRMPISGLIPEVDASIARVNLEINVQLSVLWNTIGHQGWSQLFMKLNNPMSPPPTMSLGATQAVSLEEGEDAMYLTGASPYDQITNSLHNLVQMLAIANRQSPNDFSPNAGAAASGFAKLVDSLPKLEARRDHVSRLKRIEATVLWPRIASILSREGLGRIGAGVRELYERRLVTTFSDLDFPETPIEISTLERHDLENGLRTKAEIYADRFGVPVSEAEERYAEEDVEGLPADGEIGMGATTNVQDTVLNGAQVTSLVDVVRAVSTGEIPRSSGVQILVVAFLMPQSEAERVIGDAGGSFVSSANKQPEPPTQQTEPPKPEQPQPQKPDDAKDRRGMLSSLLGGKAK